MIDILLSTYNGEKYLREQINSILNQTFQDWRLLIRDDGSQDDTVEIICEYAKQYPGKIVLQKDALGNLGCGASFSHLVSVSTAPYMMFCNQDDWWLPEKIEKSWHAMETLTKQYPDTPLLVTTDLVVVDEKLRELSPSFVQSQKLYPEALCEVHRSLALSVSPGCTMLFNRAAAEHFLPIPSHQTHDHWVAIITAYFGKVCFLPDATILYRQHGNNVIGSKKINFLYFFKRLCAFRKEIRAFKVLYQALPFPVNPFRWIFFMVYYSIRRAIQ